MLWKKRCLDHLAKALLLTTFLCGSARLVIGQNKAAVSNEFWKDSATGLTLAVKDNGSDVNWNSARDYCGSLRLGGYSDWRLPTIDELEALYDPRLTKEYKVKGPIDLSASCSWSGTTNDSGEVWSFCFSYGGKSPVTTGHGSRGRALCVRRSGE